MLSVDFLLRPKDEQVANSYQYLLLFSVEFPHLLPYIPVVKQRSGLHRCGRFSKLVSHVNTVVKGRHMYCRLLSQILYMK